MSNLILNEGYKDGLNLFERGVKDKIYTKNRSFIDISNCAGSLLLGHNHRVFKNSIKEYSKTTSTSTPRRIGKTSQNLARG